MYRDPETGGRLAIEGLAEHAGGDIREGRLATQDGSRGHQIRESIPRFVPSDNYARSFGLQWNRLRSVQLDSFTGLALSRSRFFQTSRWEPESLDGLRVLEAGCGAGRFTEVVLATGAELFAIDYSTSVDAVLASIGHHPSLHLSQADIYRLPFPEDFFDCIFCYGVLQHTPDPRRAFLSLLPHLKPGGRISIDIYLFRPYPNRWNSKYLWRPITRRLDPERLFKIVEWYIPRWLPVDRALSRIPLLGAAVACLIPCWNYTGLLPLSASQIEEWAVLDTFDALSPAYDRPATVRTVRKWMSEAGLIDVEVRRGGNGVAGNAMRPGSGG
jgi:SAM-dependent methyltransferase